MRNILNYFIKFPFSVSNVIKSNGSMDSDYLTFIAVAVF